MPEPSKPDLNTVLREERKEKLSHVDNDFYEKAQKLIRELGIELDLADKENTKYQMLEDEYNKAKKNYNSILEIRMTKINHEASVRKSLKRKDDREPENLTPEERELYNGLYSLMSGFRNKCLDISQKKTCDIPPAAEPVKKPRSGINFKDYMMVRALHDIPAFAGMDGRNYALAKEDVATVPVINANALISRGAVVRINAGAAGDPPEPQPKR